MAVYGAGYLYDAAQLCSQPVRNYPRQYFS